MNPRSRRTGLLAGGYSGGYPSSYSSYSSYPSYSSYGSYSSGYTGGYSSYYNRSTSYTGSTAPSSYPATLRSRSVEASAHAKEASVTRELYTPAREERRGGSRVREEAQQPQPPPRSSKAWGSTTSLATAPSTLPELLSSASSRFSKATASLYQKSRGALGMLRSSSLFDLRGSTSDLRGSTSDLRGSTSDLRGSNSRGSVSDLRGSTSDLRGSVSDLRGSTSDLRGSTSDLRGSTSDLRASSATSALRAARERRRTTQVSELDLSRARVWGSVARDEAGQDRRGRRGTLDLGYSSQASSRRGSLGEEPDYRKLWEESQAENEVLRKEMAGIRVELEETKRRLMEALLERMGGQDKAAMEERLAKMKEQVKELNSLREENEELRTQNSSLSLVISKMAEKAGKSTRV